MSGRGSQNGSDHASKRARHGDDDTEDPQPLSSTGGPVDAQDGALSQSEDDPRTPMTPFSPDNDDDDQDMAVNGEDLVPFGEGADDRADGGDPEEEEEGEDLFGDDMVNDYGEKAELDRYEVDQVAEEDDVEDMSIAARRQADREMRQRDEMRRLLAAGGNSNRLNNEDSDAEEDDQMGRRRRRRNNALVARYRTSRQQQQRDTPVSGGAASPYGSVPGSASQGGGSGGTPSNFQDEDALEHDPDFELEANDGTPLRDWINLDKVRMEIYRRCTAFMRTFTADKTGALVYMDRIRLMGASNSQTLVVNYPNFFSTEPNISIWLADEPAGILAIFNEAATDVTLSVFPEYGLIHPEIFVRIASLPVMDQLRDIRHIHLNTLIKVSGVVTRRSGVFPHLRVVKLNCEKCQSVLAPTATSNARPERSIALCPECGSRGPFTVNSEQTLFGNYQKLNLQESPGKVPAGRLPRYKEVILLNDLIDTARPGDEVEVTGIYRHNVDPTINIMNGFPVFSTVIEANFVRKVEDAHAETELTDDDIKDIRALSQDPRIAERVFASIAPSIYGHANIKRALALALFGGQAKEVGERHRMRGDINVLMMGDPGTAKSQFLKYVEKTAHRAVYTTGKGASAVGLTAGVHKDPVTREWTLEGGALVLADRGVCLIDEFDKMNDADRTSIHEAMEQQSISISKAGIVTTLQARCSVFAAANPVRGRYDASKSFFDNVDLTEPILSRFDVLCVVRDTVDPTVDETLAKFVVDSHMRSHPDAQDIASESDILDDKDGVDTKVAGVGMRFSDSGVELIPQELLRKYILFAKSTVSPRLANIDNNKITSLYLDLRKESMASGGMPIALRHLESIVRLAEAHARLHLRDYVREDDVNAAISVMLESFFTSQKYAVMRNLRSHFHKYLAYRKDDNDLLFYVLSGLVRDYAATQARDPTGTGAPATVEVDLEDFEARAREMNVHSCQKFYGSALFEQRRFSLDGERRKIIKTL